MKFLLMLIVLLAAVRPANGQSLTMTIRQDSGGAFLAGHGTSAGSMGLGILRRHGLGTGGVSISRNTSDWSIATTFALIVSKDPALMSGSWTLQAELQSPDAERGWSVNLVPVSFGAPTVVAPGSPYGDELPQTITITVPDGAAPGPLDNTLVLTAIAN